MNRIFRSILAVIVLLVAAPAHSPGNVFVVDPYPCVFVIGNVRSPGSILYKTDLTVMTAIATVGGTSEFGGSLIYLIRNGQSTKMRMREIKRRPETDTLLQPCDIIDVE